MLICDDIVGLPRILIKARIAAHLSHQELADKVGMTEAQIQEFEKQDYQTATFAEILEVFCALEVQLKQGEFWVGVERMVRTHQEINH
jgi:DNA-binding Xre family transcriptional regulator